ncbi:MAG: single-stranded DNA-binding protein [Elusimicrobiota bacterium]|jgi:single-strand DNA-binding protein|nr:single-stranded DNA-binding protein [Elusimicrobiota bacterium]
MNNFSGIGRIATDLVLKKSSAGMAFLSFNMAIKTPKKNKNGEALSIFINCLAFDVRAENIYKFCSKGDLLGITAYLQDGSYESKDGYKVNKIEFIITGIDFISPKKEVQKQEKEKAVEARAGAAGGGSFRKPQYETTTNNGTAFDDDDEEIPF